MKFTATFLFLAATVSCAQAQDKYGISDAARAACPGDAVRLCSSSYPDEDAMLACMKLNQSQLTTGCRPVFMAGLRRRGM